MMIPSTDAKLTTREQILERMQSIARQRDKLCSTVDRDHHVNTFNNRQAKIAALTAREDALRVRLRDMRRAGV